MDIQKAFENLGLRDYSDPDARQKAVEDNDLNINMSLVQALVATSAFDSFKILISLSDEEVTKHITTLRTFLNNNSAKDKMVQDMTELSNQTMKEIYRKQREIYAEKNH